MCVPIAQTRFCVFLKLRFVYSTEANQMVEISLEEKKKKKKKRKHILNDVNEPVKKCVEIQSLTLPCYLTDIALSTSTS